MILDKLFYSLLNMTINFDFHRRIFIITYYRELTAQIRNGKNQTVSSLTFLLSLLQGSLLL